MKDYYNSLLIELTEERRILNQKPRQNWRRIIEITLEILEIILKRYLL
jgi:hypothetical protein